VGAETSLGGPQILGLFVREHIMARESHLIHMKPDR
jgi:hypothetical protein